MAKRHFYFIFENLNLSSDGWNELIDRFKQRGSKNSPQPAKRNHQRLRLDDQAILFEALFNEQAVNENAVEGQLASILQIPPPRIDRTIVEDGDKVVTYQVDGVDSLIHTVLAGEGASWDESRLSTLDYLSLNRTEWEEE
jgi:hypothetical protein